MFDAERLLRRPAPLRRSRTCGWCPARLAGFVRDRLAAGAADLHAPVLEHADYNLSRAASTLGFNLGRSVAVEDPDPAG